MRTVLLGEPPEVLRTWLQRRRELGQDGFDEVWGGEYHVAPMAHGRQGRTEVLLARLLGPRADAAGLHGSGPLNIGTPGDYRVPDQAYLRTAETAMWNPTAAIVVEIVSPGDESMLKLEFYFGAGVQELLVLDPVERSVRCFARGPDGFTPTLDSALLGIATADIVAGLEWPD